MSLKKYKKRSQVLDDKFDYKLEWDSWYTYWDFDDDDFDYSPCDNCGESYCNDYEYCQPYDYIELPEINWGYKLIEKSNGRWYVFDPSLCGGYIDMRTIYGKIEMRNRIIDIVFGLREPDYIQTVTIGDFFDR